MKFVTDAFSEEEANIIVFSCEAAKSLRTVSQLVEPFSIEKRKNLLENSRIFDAGEIEFKKIKEKVKEVLEKNKLPILLAEKHTASLEALKVLPKDTKIIIFDAHADLKDEYLGEKISYATWLRRVCEIIPTKNICLVGIRSCDDDEYNFMKENNILYFTAEEVKENVNTLNKLKEFATGSIYMSIDIDVFDPSIAPAVDNPVPNGLTYKEFLDLAKLICTAKVVGIDLVEIRPLPKNRITEFLAVKILFEILNLINK